MFRNKLLLAAIVSLLFLVVIGCGSKAASNGDSEQKDDKSTEGSVSGSNQQAPPENAPDLVGKVAAIDGSKVTVYKVNMPDNIAPPENGQNNNAPRGETPKPQGQPEPTAQQGPPEDTGRQPPETREDMFQVTEETYDLVINADTRMERGFGRDPGGNESTQLRIEDIQTGDILRLWLGEKLSGGEQTVKSIQLMQ